MLIPKLQVLQGTLKRLMRRGATGPLEKVVAKTYAADLAYLLPHFSEAEQRVLLAACGDVEKRASVLAKSSKDISARYVGELPKDKAIEILHQMEPDDVSDLLEHLPEDTADDLLNRMRIVDRTQVEDLVRYDSATAGGIMSPRCFALQSDVTVREAIEHLQRVDTELEMVFYVYVVNDVSQLLGVVSLRQLVITRPDNKLSELMTSDVITVQPEVHQEEVAKLAARYGFLAIPVVDTSNKLLGIVTVDDVIDVIREEATEDILRMAGAGGEQMQQPSVLRSVWARFPWLLATCTGGTLAAAILSAYQESFQRYLPIVFFMPLVLGLAGVSGRQGATITAQYISQGLGGWRLMTQVARQAIIGFLLGSICGVLVGLTNWAWLGRLIPNELLSSAAGLVLGIGTTAAVMVATLVGGLLPALFARVRVDPTIATGPFVTIAVDLTGLFLYVFIAGLFWHR